MNQINTIALMGIEATPVLVQIELIKTIPSFVIVGMANRAITESKERIRGVFNSCKLPFPLGKIIVNLSPADIVKEGSHYDLPIIIGLLQSMGLIKINYDDFIFFGELSLNGEIIKTKGFLSVVLYCYQHHKKIIVHESYYEETAYILQEKSYLIVVANNLLDIINNNFKTMNLLGHYAVTNYENINLFNDIIGHGIAKRAAAISLIGSHNILFFGPPGSGKSLISKSMENFLWPLNQEDKLLVSSIYSAAGLLEDNQLIHHKPFRNPHNSSSYASLLGGGNIFRPGEISLAHKGILFLDELAEFPSSILDMLRQVLDDKQIIIGRANYNIKIPSDFQLLATMNPCKCGYFKDNQKKCICSSYQIQQYQKKISGPLLDRIDMKIFMGNNYNGDENQWNYDKNYDYVKFIIEGKNFYNKRNIYHICNNNLQQNHISLLNFEDEGLKIVNDFCKKNFLSMRRQLKILGVARTIADSDLSSVVQVNHCLESLFFTSKMSYQY